MVVAVIPARADTRALSSAPALGYTLTPALAPALAPIPALAPACTCCPTLPPPVIACFAEAQAEKIRECESLSASRFQRTGTGLAGVRLLLLLLVFQGLSGGRNSLSRAGQETQGDGQSHGYPLWNAAEHTCQGSGA